MEHTMLNTTFPVDLPDLPELKLSKDDFTAYLESALAKISADPATVTSVKDATNLPILTKPDTEAGDTAAGKGSQFMDRLLADKAAVPTLDERDGKMLTENADVAYRSSGETLVDLFQELEDVISGSRLTEVLDKAWAADPDGTLKIIWNARSIHLGKSSRLTFYRAVGWLAEKHPLTLLVNLPWLVRPLIQKKAPKKDEGTGGKPEKADSKPDESAADSDYELIGEDGELEGQPQAKKAKLDEGEISEFDIKYGVAHGYWKDLLNILALAVNGQLKADGGDPRSILNVPKVKEKAYKKDWTPGKKKAQITERHDRAVKKLADDPFYKTLHITVARLFADQLTTDLARLQSGNKADIKRITLAAKWAPSHKGMHDQHTCIVSSIAELLHPFDTVCPEADPGDRTLYLKHAREAYQLKTLSPLRKTLQIVERPITDNKFEDIKYDRLPSLAMKQYTLLFAKKDFDRFDKYIDGVAQGKSRISGATLLPSTLVSSVSTSTYSVGRPAKGANALVEKKMKELQARATDGQWNSLVQRIKDSGTMESSIAVCDVSGSMGGPTFPDTTCPMDSAIGLSLLLAEITEPPFGGAFITFSAKPQVVRVGGADDKRSFQEKVSYIKASNWGMNTDFVAVFEKLILPMAVKNKLKQEDMVKQVFVFSDMQFDSAGNSGDWRTSYERIQDKFKAAGYDMPKLIFWNLAGGRAGYGDPSNNKCNGTAPKPVTAAEEGTALVSGYSQGQLKMFLENGQFDEPEEEEVIEEKEGEDGAIVVEKTKKAKMDPLIVVKKAISHEAYRMLKVVD